MFAEFLCLHRCWVFFLCRLSILLGSSSSNMSKKIFFGIISSIFIALYVINIMCVNVYVVLSSLELVVWKQFMRKISFLQLYLKFDRVHIHTYNVKLLLYFRFFFIISLRIFIWYRNRITFSGWTHTKNSFVYYTEHTFTTYAKTELEISKSAAYQNIYLTELISMQIKRRYANISQSSFFLHVSSLCIRE